MKVILSIVIGAFFVFPAFAQEDTDQATIRCYYLFSQKKNKSDAEFSFRDTLTLDVGSYMSRYYDERKMQRDSAFRSILPNFDTNRITSISVLKNQESNILENSLGDTYGSNSYDGVSEQIYKNRRNGTIILLNTLGGLAGEWYKGTDPVGVMNWTIEPETAVFFDYPCQKASLRFRGRNYEAWFAPQIPINDGPWKFFGLPGLILKVKDLDEQFVFECIGLEYLNTPYTVEIPKHKYFETNRKDYMKVMSRKSGGQMININGGNIIIAELKAEPSILVLELE
jgi:GLPGLI family protein